MRFISLIVYLVLQIAFIPFAVAGVVWVAYKQLVVSKRLGVSQTAIEVLNGRWTMHVFGMREDDASKRLARVLPNTSTFGLWLVLFPSWVKYKMTGSYFAYPRIPEEGDEDVGHLVTARTLYFDRILDRVAPEVEQFVIMGAGYDTRGYWQFDRDGLAVFELDRGPMQAHKRAMLTKARIDTGDVKFVAVDFGEDDVFGELQKAGYDPREKTMFLWEGVTLYLSEDDVRKTLRDLRAHAAEGSVVALDLYGERFLKIAKAGAGQKTLELTNEGLAFGLDLREGFEETLRRFAESEGFGVGETCFMGARSPEGPFMVVAEFTV